MYEQEVSSYIDQFIGNTGAFNIIGVVTLIVVTLLMFLSIEAVFRRILRYSPTRNLLEKFTAFTAILFWTPLILFVSFFVSAKVRYVLANYLSQIANIEKIVLYIFPFIITCTGFFLFYYVIPKGVVTLKAALLAGCSMGLVWELLKIGFLVYISTYPFYKTIYGSLAIIPILFIWIFLSWALVLFGLEVIYTLDNYDTIYSDDIYLDNVRNKQFLYVYSIWLLLKLIGCYKKNDVLQIKAFRNLKDFHVINKAAELLKERNIIGYSGKADQAIALSRSPGQISLLEVHNEIYGDIDAIANIRLTGDLEKARLFIMDLYKKDLAHITIDQIPRLMQGDTAR